MPKVRKEIPELEKLVQVGRKNFFVMRKGHKGFTGSFYGKIEKKEL